MTGLTAPDQKLVGRFRGESGLEREQVFVGARKGSDAKLVAGEVKACIERLQSVLNRLDALLPVGKALDRDSLQAVIEVSAWVHSEWVRIHPFGNGNGRVARTFTNAILMRYGLPPVLKLRPRPASPYGYAGAEGMARNTKPMESLLTQLLRALP